MLTTFSTSVDLVMSVISFLFPIVCLFEGTRRMANQGVSKNHVLLAVLGFVVLLGNFGFSYWVHEFQMETLQTLRKGINVPDLPPEWGSNFPTERRNANSLALARAAFLEHGLLRHYFSKSGERLVFTPTQTDLEERENNIIGLAKLEASAEDTAILPVRFAITICLAVLFGVGFGHTQPKVANPSPNPDGPPSGGGPVS
jgi:hypothetical protein